MSQALSSLKMAAALMSNQTSRRGFAAVAQGLEASRRKLVAEKPAEKEEPAPWMPHPVTGYYRPENMVNQIFAAEMREALLKPSRNRKN